MLLTSKSVSDIKYKTKRYKLDKADAEIIVALIPVELMNEVRQEADEPTKNELGMKILLAAVVDADGNPAFASVEEFRRLPLAVQNEIADKVYEYNGLTGNPEKN